MQHVKNPRDVDGDLSEKCTGPGERSDASRLVHKQRVASRDVACCYAL